ncbi:choline/carnitine/betaine transport [Halopolyspora algeriensis]|uniref:Choline/carnitine/betaine transport n=1 Tax=Halopolyspora algeriensis TaxID=1500506 RepID=A0A368VZ88_9ACTN|nr:BCCT family transporter [Halopolyspora algeriensis]RCW47271.1 choline/carnitine/betaine transport [Halopolyspora algeriensis]TQM42507.1 choline/carnitine/betaine transport [Halopolyspora algeriensis]
MPVSTDASGTQAENDQQQQGLAEQPGRTDWRIFSVAAVIALAFVTWGASFPSSLANTASAALTFLVRDAGWVFVLAGTTFVIFAVWLAFSRYGRIRLGAEDEEPEFHTASWIAMMFAAGMGIGLMFYGVSEPLSHFADPPPGTVPAGTDAAARTAMATSLFHWTLHPWSIYAVVGLALAYSSYRRGRPQLLSSAFAPFFANQRSGGLGGKVIDTLAILATIFGTAASLGLGATQIRSGLQQVGWLGQAGSTTLVVIIALLIGAFVASAVSGVARGIQYLSNSNMVLATFVAVFTLVTGPTVFILDLLPTSVGTYFSQFGGMVSRAGAFGGAEMQTWLSNWTIFYWAWWISWSPFVGMFIARISRGRTVRQFIGGVLLVPSVISLIWFAILGGTAIQMQRTGTDLAAAGDTEAQLFGMLQNLPWGTVVSVVAMILIINFFITSADSASIVIGSLSQHGSVHPKTWVVVFWGLVIGAVATVMLLSGGSDALTGLQNITIIASSPFVLVVLLLCVSLVKDMNTDTLMLRDTKAAEVLEQAVITGTEEHEGEFQLSVSPAESTGSSGKSADSEGSGDTDSSGSGRTGGASSG